MYTTQTLLSILSLERRKEEKWEAHNMVSEKLFLEKIIKERPVGTEGNAAVYELIKQALEEVSYSITEIPFDCTVWEDGNAYLKTAEEKQMLFTSPFSEAFAGEGKLVILSNRAELKEKDIRDKIVVLGGELAQNAVQPKDYPFYYPDEDRQLIDILEQGSPKAILACTGRSMLCGLEPFPIFTDGNFLIPSAYLSEQALDKLQNLNGQSVEIVIHSKKYAAKSKQLIAVKKAKNSKGKVILCAHMDTQYHTPGALDNAAGIAVMIETVKKLAQLELDRDIEVVPFNGEEYYEASGEMAYLGYLSQQSTQDTLVINIDSPCHKGAQTAIAYYNIADQQQEQFNALMKMHPGIVAGEPWYAGDHCMFAFQGIPCLTVSSSDLFEGGLKDTHTERDTIETLDPSYIQKTADYLAELMEILKGSR